MLTKNSGVSLIELSVSIGLMGIVLATLFNLFSTTCTATSSAKSKIFINAQEKRITKQLENEFASLQKINNFPPALEDPLGKNETPGEDFHLKEAKAELEYTNASGEHCLIHNVNGCLTITTQSASQRTYSESCIREILFASNAGDERYVLVRISFFDPANPKFKTDPSNDYVYQGIFFARNMQRM